MSRATTSTSTAPTTTTTTSEHLHTLRDQAFELYCSGMRSPAISQQLGVPERTIRAWIAATCEEVAKARTGTAQAAAALAEARHLQIAAAAWEAYRRHAQAEQRQLADLQFATRDELDEHPPRLSSGGARYLALALRATDLAARLAGAYTCPPPQPAAVEFILTRSYRSPAEIVPPHDQPQLSGLELEQYRYQEYVRGLTAQCASDQEQLAKGRARLAELDALLAPQPASSPADADDPDADEDNDEDDASADDGDGDTDEPDSPAETATALESGIPAETAITPNAEAEYAAESAMAMATATIATGLAAGIGTPANHEPTDSSPSLASAGHAAPLSPQGAARAKVATMEERSGPRAERGAGGEVSLRLP